MFCLAAENHEIAFLTGTAFRARIERAVRSSSPFRWERISTCETIGGPRTEEHSTGFEWPRTASWLSQCRDPLGIDINLATLAAKALEASRSEIGLRIRAFMLSFFMVAAVSGPISERSRNWSWEPQIRTGRFNRRSSPTISSSPTLSAVSSENKSARPEPQPPSYSSMSLLAPDLNPIEQCSLTVYQEGARTNR